VVVEARAANSDWELRDGPCDKDGGLLSSVPVFFNRTSRAFTTKKASMTGRRRAKRPAIDDEEDRDGFLSLLEGWEPLPPCRPGADGVEEEELAPWGVAGTSELEEEEEEDCCCFCCAEALSSSRVPTTVRQRDSSSHNPSRFSLFKRSESNSGSSSAKADTVCSTLRSFISLEVDDSVTTDAGTEAGRPDSALTVSWTSEPN